MITVIDNPMMPHPIIERGEFSAVLPAEQTVNFAEVQKAYDAQAAKKLSEKQRGDILEEFYRQPIMAGMYRKNGIKPEQVDDFIQYLKNDFPRKDVLIDNFYGTYGQAAHAQEGFENGKLKVAGEEWRTLEDMLKKSPTLNSPMRQFVSAQKEAEKEQNTTSSAIKDIVKGAKVIATGIVAAIALTPLAQRLMKITAKEDMQKVEAYQKKMAKMANMQKTADMPINKDKVNE